MKKFQITLEDLANNVIITLPIPVKHDNTVSIYMENNVINVQFNTDFVENYEKRLNDNTSDDLTIMEAMHYRPDPI